MNDLKQNLTRFLDYAVKHLNLNPSKWEIESEQDTIVLRSNEAVQADMLRVVLAGSNTSLEFALEIEPERITKWNVKRAEIAISCGVD